MRIAKRYFNFGLKGLYKNPKIQLIHYSLDPLTSDLVVVLWQR